MEESDLSNIFGQNENKEPGTGIPPDADVPPAGSEVRRGRTPGRPVGGDPLRRAGDKMSAGHLHNAPPIAPGNDVHSGRSDDTLDPGSPDPDIDRFISEWAEFLDETGVDFKDLPDEVRDALLTRRISVGEGRAMLECVSLKKRVGELEHELEIQRKKAGEVINAVSNSSKNPGVVGGGVGEDPDAFLEGFGSV